MEEHRFNCDREIRIQQLKSDNSISFFHKSMESERSIAQMTSQNQAKLGKLKAQLRRVEDDLVKALAARTRKEANQISLMDSIVATKARVDDLKRVVEEQISRKNEYAEIISQQSKVLSALEEKCDKDSERRGEIEEAISWYNRVLGFQIECGHEIKFILTNINSKNHEEEYSFTIRHENDIYSLLDCDPNPNMSDTNEMIELNKNNGLFQFVRTMREKFLQAAICGINPNFITHEQETSTISASSTVSSISTDSRSQSPAKQKTLQVGICHVIRS